MDLSDAMLAKDQKLSDTHKLAIRCEQGSMTDLSRFEGAEFDLVFLPVAVCYVADVLGVWRECARVLRSGGRLLMGSVNPLVYLFAENEGQAGQGLEVVQRLPFVEYEALTETQRAAALARGMVFVWSHTLTTLIDGQLQAGFRLLNFAEARRQDARAPSINAFTDTYLMTAAERV